MKKFTQLGLGFAIATVSAWTSANVSAAQATVYQEAYALYVLLHPDLKAQSSKAIIQQYSQDYAALFDKNKKVSEQQFIQFEQQQLDAIMDKRRDMSLKQTHVRYGILDADKNKKLTLKEFQDIGLKSFTEYDKDSDGIVTAADVKLKAGSGTETHDGFRVRLPISMPMANNPSEFIQQYGKGKAYATLGDYLTGRDQQFFTTDSNQDLVVTEQEYVDEFMQRYDRNTLEGKEKMKLLSARKFREIAAGQAMIQAKDIQKFAQKLDQSIGQ